MNQFKIIKLETQKKLYQKKMNKILLDQPRFNTLKLLRA